MSMFAVSEEPLRGARVLEPRYFADERGAFVKTFHESLFQEMGISFTPREEFFSVSKRNVLRGMHFQVPPHDHHKLVYCIAGRILDVIVDLRVGSETYGHYASVELSAENRRLFFIPTGFAHGFLALEEDAVMVYKTDHVYAPESDLGIAWDSFEFTWPVAQPVISQRDIEFPPLEQFVSPFRI